MQDHLGEPQEQGSCATVEIGSRRFVVPRSRPFYFGRADGPDVVGLEASDRGISSYAGSVEWDGRWFVTNPSHKCQLLLDEGRGGGVLSLDCLHAHAINVERLAVWVRGSIRRHPIVVTVPVEDLPRVDLNRPPTRPGTVTGATLNGAERLVVVALFEGYLLSPPRHEPHPRSYAEAAERLADGRTRDSARKQIEHLRERLRKQDLYFEGPHANYEMAEYFIRYKLITADDLGLLPPR